MSLERLLVAAGLLAVVALAALVRTWRQGAGYRPARASVPERLLPEAARDRWAILGVTSPLCHACQATEAIARQAIEASDPPDARPVAFVSLPVAEHRELIDLLEITSTPTVLVLDPAGRIRLAQAGNPSPAVLAEALPAAERRPAPAEPPRSTGRPSG